MLLQRTLAVPRCRSSRPQHLSKLASRVPASSFATSSDEEVLHKTALNDLHKKLKGTMVPFCGWEMPVKYDANTIVESHLHTRKHASLFDVSHMLQLRWDGADRIKFLESLTVADLKSLTPGNSKLSVLMNEEGGIVDDTVITQNKDHIYMVVNAGCADKDRAYFKKHMEKFKGDVSLKQIDQSLLALQGPSAEKVLQSLVKEKVDNMPFMSSKDMTVDGIPCIVTRCGYTGEDGFEISVPHEASVKLAEKLLSHAEVKPAGLGARDTLRLEAGLCLYGNDLNETISPVEAALTWCIGKRRKEEGGFLGAEKVLKQLADPALVTRRRVGFIGSGPPARDHTKIFVDSKEVGEITSGTMSPILNKPISMGYIQSGFHKTGQEVMVQVRGKMHKAVVSKMPFVPSNYKKL